MSTRANIILKDKHDKLYFYKHSDGYPNGTLPLLKKFMRWAEQGRIRRNVEQAGGWLIIIGADQYNYIIGKDGEQIDCKPKKALEPNPEDISGWKVGAIEPATGIHGDIEYKYTIDLNKMEIKIHSIDEGNEEIKKIITNFEKG